MRLLDFCIADTETEQIWTFKRNVFELPPKEQVQARYIDNWILFYEEHTRPITFYYEDNVIQDVWNNFYSLSSLYVYSPNTAFFYRNNLYTNYTGRHTMAELEFTSTIPVVLENTTVADITYTGFALLYTSKNRKFLGDGFTFRNIDISGGSETTSLFYIVPEVDTLELDLHGMSF